MSPNQLEIPRQSRVERTRHHHTRNQNPNQSDASEAHVFFHHQEPNPRQSLSWRRKDTKNNQRSIHRDTATRLGGTVRNDADGNAEENRDSQPAHSRGSILHRHHSNSNNSAMNGCDSNNDSILYDLSIPAYKRSCTGHIATNSSTVLATLAWFTRSNFKIRRINASLASNPVTPPSERPISSQIRSSPVAIIHRQDIEDSVEESELSQGTSRSAPKYLEEPEIQIQGGEATLTRPSGAIVASVAAYSSRPNRIFGYTLMSPSKTWISRFIDMQKSTKSSRKKEYKNKASRQQRKVSGWGFSSKKAEYLKSGLELSYEEASKADRKFQRLPSSNSKTGRARKGRPGSSNLRYCLTYANPISDDASRMSCDWGYNRMRLWLSSASTTYYAGGYQRL
ncbi:hypothetical protein DSL72_005560 [Monilinia vaccinii-corymbosi]|uniref:Uncharacterized protein n=1 Tax=Monilinia vaccinii-corymbosi TaxID=61207 RepID=A0A8A3PFY0_9HELO|nr:hypothetical protein DSL72_005560 [Monilinia vaccinii-corymbosi]